MMNKSVFHQILTSLAEEAIPTKQDALSVFSEKLEKKKVTFGRVDHFAQILGRHPALVNGGLTLFILLILIVLFLTPQIQVITAGIFRFFNPVATQTNPVNLTLTSTLQSTQMVTVDANQYSPVAGYISTPDCGDLDNADFDIINPSLSAQNQKIFNKNEAVFMKTSIK